MQYVALPYIKYVACRAKSLEEIRNNNYAVNNVDYLSYSALELVSVKIFLAFQKLNGRKLKAKRIRGRATEVEEREDCEVEPMRWRRKRCGD